MCFIDEYFFFTGVKYKLINDVKWDFELNMDYDQCF